MCGTKNLLIFSLVAAFILPLAVFAQLPQGGQQAEAVAIANCKTKFAGDMQVCFEEVKGKLPWIIGDPFGKCMEKSIIEDKMICIEGCCTKWASDKYGVCKEGATKSLEICMDKAMGRPLTPSTGPAAPAGGAPGTGGQQGGAPSTGLQTTGGGDELANPLGVKTFGDFITKIFDALQPIILALAVFFIVLAGFQFLTAQGNEEKIKKAKETLFWTVIGVAVAIGARILIEVIRDILISL